MRRRSVVVYLLDGQTIRGVLVDAYRDCIRVAHAEHLEQDKRPVELGDVTIERNRVSFYQETGG